MSAAATYLPEPRVCPPCERAGNSRTTYPAYCDRFEGLDVIRVACALHRHPVVFRRYTGTAKSNWGTVGASAPDYGHGPQANEPEAAEAGPQVPNVAEIERAVKEALEEMKAQEAEET